MLVHSKIPNGSLGTHSQSRLQLLPSFTARDDEVSVSHLDDDDRRSLGGRCDDEVSESRQKAAVIETK